jgi:hypothetical protein
VFHVAENFNFVFFQPWKDESSPALQDKYCDLSKAKGPVHLLQSMPNHTLIVNTEPHYFSTGTNYLT